MGKRQCALCGITQASVVSDQFLAQVHDVNVPRSACAPGSGNEVNRIDEDYFDGENL